MRRKKFVLMIMKNVSLVLNVVLLLAVAVLYYFHFSGSQEQPESAQGVSPDLAVAYVNSDSIFNQYKFVTDFKGVLESKSADAQKKLENRMQTLQREVEDFQRTAGNMTINQARALEEDLVRKRQNLQVYEQTLSQELMKEEAEFTEELYDKLTSYLKDYGTTHNLQMVLSYQKGSGVLFASDSLDITETVIEALNTNYDNEKADDSKAASEDAE